MELNLEGIYSRITYAISDWEQTMSATAEEVYLGDDEWAALEKLMAAWGAEWSGGADYNPRTGARASFLTCPIFRVDAKSHLKVGGRTAMNHE
jgi:hypothetical protein